MTPTNPTQISRPTHIQYLRQCIDLARHSPPKPTNFRVGCVIVSNDQVLSTGYTLELEGNTHAEQCALIKLARKHSISEDRLDQVLTPDVNAVLYTSLEPCGKRLSGNLPCVARIIETRKSESQGYGIQKVVFGAKEPGTFVKDSRSIQMLTDAGVPWDYINDLENEILIVAMEGHARPHPNQVTVTQDRSSQQNSGVVPSADNSVDNVAERQWQEAQPRNPKKRMMEVPPNDATSK